MSCFFLNSLLDVKFAEHDTDFTSAEKVVWRMGEFKHMKEMVIPIDFSYSNCFSAKGNNYL